MVVTMQKHIKSSYTLIIKHIMKLHAIKLIALFVFIAAKIACFISVNEKKSYRPFIASLL